MSGWCGSSHPVSGCDGGTPTSSKSGTGTQLQMELLADVFWFPAVREKTMPQALGM